MAAFMKEYTWLATVTCKAESKLIIIDSQTNHQSALETQGTLSQCTRMQATAAATSGCQCIIETIYIYHM